MCIDRAVVRDLYLSLYHNNDGALGSYYRALYHVFKLIWDSDLDDSSQVKYANVARSTLANDELLMLAVNCLTDQGKNFGSLVEQYGLLKHLSSMGDPRSIDQRIGKDLYAPSAMLSYRDRITRWQTYPAERAKLDDRLKAL